MQIFVVVPTCRPESWREFLPAWEPLFRKHKVVLCKVNDGEFPELEVLYYDGCTSRTFTVLDIMDGYGDVIFNRTDACRNLGFAYAAGHKDAQIIISLDDDVRPLPDTDPIEEHLDILSRRTCIDWFSSTESEQHGVLMRGFPYGIREQAPVMFSHGVWHGVPDLDGPSQLVLRHMMKRKYEGPFYRGPIPHGCLAPICGMNVAFRREALPYVYYAPMGPKAFNLNRFADIWMGVSAKKAFDRLGWAMWTGEAAVFHSRASNTLRNVRLEGEGLELNELFWNEFDENIRPHSPGSSNHPYFALYAVRLSRWKQFLAAESEEFKGSL